MINQFEDIQKLNQANIDATMRAFGEWTRGWQAITAEITDYSKRSFEQGAQTMEKLMAAKSMEQALEIQAGFAKRSYDDYMQQLTKIGTLYAGLAKEAYRPMEKFMDQAGR